MCIRDRTCPMRTGNALKKMAENHLSNVTNSAIPFWRVIRSDKLIIKSKKIEFSASLIEAEGFKLNYTKSGAIKVEVGEEDIFIF